MLVGRGGYILANIGENVASGLPKIGKIASSFLAESLGAGAEGKAEEEDGFFVR